MEQLTFSKTTDQSIGPSVENLANALGIPTSDLKAALTIDANDRYIPFRVSGGTRVVHRTNPRIKQIQQKIKNRILADCIKYPKYVFGSIKDPDFTRDYVNCARQHCGAKSILKVDIEKFFDNIDYVVVHDIFKKLFCYPDIICDMLCDLTTHEGFLPQGAPTSSHLATLCLFDKEPDIARLAKSKGLVYTRLMDDITVSSKKFNYDFQRMERMITDMIDSKRLTINKEKSNTTPVVTSTTTLHGLKISSGKLRVSDKTLSNLRAGIKNLEEDAEIPNVRTTESYRKRYESISGKLTVLQRLEHPKYSRYRTRLKKIRFITDYRESHS
jgi:RNA-directed DNA polymerase